MGKRDFNEAVAHRHLCVQNIPFSVIEFTWKKEEKKGKKEKKKLSLRVYYTI